MNISSAIIEQLFTFWFIIPILLALGILKTSWFKGIWGEFVVNTLAKLQLDKNIYYIAKNVTLPLEEGSTQIDHVIVSIYGIFVVETKNMKGWIFGKKSQKMWTQKIYKHSQKFQNPLHQNYKHVKALQTLLGLADNELYSLVVFVGDSSFKTDMPDNVTYGMGYIRYIKSKTEVLFSDEQVQIFVEQIQTGRYPRTLTTHRQHVKHVKTIIRKKENEKLCPKCGSTMILRTAKKGEHQGNQFWGCSTFPKCRYVLRANNSI